MLSLSERSGLIPYLLASILDLPKHVKATNEDDDDILERNDQLQLQLQFKLGLSLSCVIVLDT